MKRAIAISGSSGLIGSSLVPFLAARGHQALRIVRRRADPARGEIGWDPDAGTLDAERLEGCEAVVHLAGRSIASGRWSEATKAAILRSRADGTRRLAEALAGLSRPPKTLVCASAIGFYGDRGDEALAEDSPAGSGFLSEVTRAWEQACAPAAGHGIRVVNLRFGVVLAAGGGALARMLPAFRLGAGGRIGSGRQWMSWVALDDVLGAVVFALEREDLAGPVNVVAPFPLRNGEFAATLGRVLRRPAVVPLPTLVVRLALGEMGEALLLGSQRVQPRVLLDAGFTFRHPRLEEALRYELGRKVAA